MRGSVLLTAASGRLFVVLASVHHLSLGALSDQVSAHAWNIFETMTWWKRRVSGCVKRIKSREETNGKLLQTPLKVNSNQQ